MDSHDGGLIQPAHSNKFRVVLIHQFNLGKTLAGTQLKEIEPVDPQTILLDVKEKTLSTRSVWAIILSAEGHYPPCGQAGRVYHV